MGSFARSWNASSRLVLQKSTLGCTHLGRPHSLCSKTSQGLARKNTVKDTSCCQRSKYNRCSIIEQTRSFSSDDNGKKSVTALFIPVPVKPVNINPDDINIGEELGGSLKNKKGRPCKYIANLIKRGSSLWIILCFIVNFSFSVLSHSRLAKSNKK